MINFLDISNRFQDQWVVLDGCYRVVDHGNNFAELRQRHVGARRTFYFASR